MTAESPRMPMMLMMLLPRMFPSTISVLPPSEAKKLMMNSGADVPKDTIVSPMTMLGMFRRFARDDALSTSMSAP